MTKLMINRNPLTKKKIFCSLLGGAAIFALAGSASAVGLDANVSAGARGNTGSMEAPAAASAGVNASGSAGANTQGSSHMSAEGNTNQNSRMTPESTKGMERAHERMSGMGSEHEQAAHAGTKTQHSIKSHHKVKSKAKSEAQ
ncbi:MAG: hypothetical protein V4563_12685 [Pseudomonadota bacterium]